jgi:hypothetical protein
MKANISRNATKVTLLAAMLLAVSLFAGSANAQSGFRGKFTLDHQTRWGQAVLPAGHYLLTFDDHLSDMLVVSDAKSHRRVAYEPSNNRQDSTKGESALLVSVRGSQRIVNSFRVAELGQTFIYDHSLASRRAVEEANNTETVPVMEARK